MPGIEDKMLEDFLKFRLELVKDQPGELQAFIDLWNFQDEQARLNPPTKPHPDWQIDVPDE